MRLTTVEACNTCPLDLLIVCFWRWGLKRETAVFFCGACLGVLIGRLVGLGWLVGWLVVELYEFCVVLVPFVGRLA